MRVPFIGHTRRGDAVLSSGLLGHLIPGARVAVFGAGATAAVAPWRRARGEAV